MIENFEQSRTTFLYLQWLAISNLTDTNSNLSETQHSILISTDFNFYLQKLKIFPSQSHNLTNSTYLHLQVMVFVIFWLPLSPTDSRHKHVKHDPDQTNSYLT